MDWQKLSEKVHKVGFKSVTLKLFQTPDGREAEFTTWSVVGKNVGVIAVTADKKIVIARQFRQGPEQVFDEIPGGGVEDGEEPENAAARELLEETGYQSYKALIFLGVNYRDAYQNEVNHYFMAVDCEKVAEQQLDPNESVQVVTVDIDTFIRNAKTGKMTDTAAVFLAYDRLMQLKASSD